MSTARPVVLSANRRIFRAAGAVAAAGIVVKLVAMGKEFVVAGVFGRTDAMDAFLAAFLLPGLLINLISESMNQALAPTLVRVRALEGHDRAQRLLSNAMLWSCGLLALVSLAMALGARGFFPLIAANFSAAKLDLSVRIFYTLLPVVLLAGIASNCTAVLNTLDRFLMPALAAVVTPLLTIACALALGARLGIYALSAAAVGGALLQAVWMAWSMDAHGYRFRLRWYGMDEPTREVARQYGPVLLSSVVSSGGLLVDQAMAAMLPAGSVSALVYANRFVSVVLTLLGGAVASAATPPLAELVAHRDWSECRRTVRTWLGITAFVSIPIAGALMLGANPLIRLAFQHGAFHAEDTSAVVPVLVFYSIQIPFFVCSRVFYRFLLAMRRSDLILCCGVLNLALDVLLNLLLMRRMGVAGIALATSLWTVSTFAFLGWWTWRLLRVADGGVR